MSPRRALAGWLLGGWVCLVGACADPLVEQSYATTGQESINGLDAFLALLEDEVVTQREGRLLRTASFTRRVREESDLVVFFEKIADESEEPFKNLEAYLFDGDPEEMELLPEMQTDPALEVEDLEWDSEPESAGEGESPGMPHQPDGSDEFKEYDDYKNSPDSNPELEGQGAPVEIRHTLTRRPGAITRSDVARSSRASPELSDAPLSGDFEDEGYKTIVYFLRDTDANLSFWSMLRYQLRDHPQHVAYVDSQIQQSQLQRAAESPGFLAPLSQRRTAYSGGELLSDLIFNRDAFPVRDFPPGSLRYPVRVVPGAAHSFYGLDEQMDLELSPTALLQSGRGEDLIREIELPRARLILVFNSEAFLNHSLVHAPNRRLTRALLAYALRLHEGGEAAPVAAFVRNTLLESEAASREEMSMLRFLTVFPVNLIVLQFAFLLVLFLISRWPHARRPLGNPESGTREFLEHIRALGVRLSRTERGRRMQALEPLIKYKQRTTGRDYRPVVEAIARMTGESLDDPDEAQQAGGSKGNRNS